MCFNSKNIILYKNGNDIILFNNDIYIIIFEEKTSLILTNTSMLNNILVDIPMCILCF